MPASITYMDMMEVRSFIYGSGYDENVPYGCENQNLANVASAKYNFLRAFPENLKQLPSILTKSGLECDVRNSVKPNLTPEFWSPVACWLTQLKHLTNKKYSHALSTL